MKEINIARTLISKRKEKGVTQEELARYIGVSKASVSKWETRQSYPDIVFLPQLAAYFDISIDELMDYEPQMTKENIRALYKKLSADFATRPFDTVLHACLDIAKKYFSCYPLLFQIGALLVNYSMLADRQEKTKEVFEKAKELFVRVKEENDDIELTRQALNMEALCLLSLGRPDEVVALLGDAPLTITSTETLLASAYQMTGKLKDAKSILQVGMYQYLVGLMGNMNAYLPLCTDDEEQFEESVVRMRAIADAFHLDTLHPALLMSFYIIAAQGYCINGSSNKALECLEKYCALAVGAVYPLLLHGDEFFSLIGNWLDDLALGTMSPRDDETIRKSIIDAVENNPAFISLHEEGQFKEILTGLKRGMEQKGDRI